MAVTNPKESLNNLYGLMMEINYHRPEEDVLGELQDHTDPFVEKHLKLVKQLSARFRAAANKKRYNDALDQLKSLKEKGFEELKKLLSFQDQVELQPLFRKFEGLTPEDEASILEDQEVLKLMEILKSRLDNNAGD
ncbi:hypothetical protein [Rufibacter sp. XAAS-G3-1]|uniref:hypothetical protein n=1 Tax=Rufibacter sp. XAAS-G3-1 TaxID=2729134 RepID=UPI0015E65CDB|nr:hypothetical protein [Rufibacter sp. XAAS-G3-1]